MPDKDASAYAKKVLRKTTWFIFIALKFYIGYLVENLGFLSKKYSFKKNERKSCTQK